MRVALILFVHNDLPYIRTTLPYDMRWADQVCILDLASTDGTEEYCLEYLRPGDRYVRRLVNTVPDLGFAEAANAAGALSDCDWLLTGMADQMLTSDSARRIHAVLEKAVAPVLSMSVRDIPYIEGDTLTTVERALNRVCPSRFESTRRLVRRDAGIDWKGYIHEELFNGEINAHHFSHPSSLTTIHLGDWGSRPVRPTRTHWMLRNAVLNPELQRYTNRWWYQTFCRENMPLIEANARLYEEYVASTGLK